MNIKTIIHEKYPDTEIHVCKDRLDSEVHGIVDLLHTMFDTAFTGTDEAGNRCAVRPSEIYSFYAEGQRVIALGETKRYTLSEKLYQLEKMLEKAGFVRISKSEIVNFRKIKLLDLGMTGTIRVILKNGYETYASRRNVAKIREMLKKETDNPLNEPSKKKGELS